jgi:phosphoglycolate phosphatase
MNKLPKAIIFDWDNTILDTWPLIQDAIDETMVEMGKEPWGLKKVKQNIHKSMKESFPGIFGNEWQKAGQIYRDSYKRSHLENLVMLPDAINLVNKASDLGIMLLVVSNKMGSTLRDEVKHLGISDKFFALIGASDAQYDKPDKAVVELALEGSEISTHSDLIWFMGDSYVDIECAVNSGCQPVLYNENNNLSSDLIRRTKEDTSKPLLHFTNHQDVINYLEA